VLLSFAMKTQFGPTLMEHTQTMTAAWMQFWMRYANGAQTALTSTGQLQIFCAP
jgi:hypothetical protein